MRKPDNCITKKGFAYGSSVSPHPHFMHTRRAYCLRRLRGPGATKGRCGCNLPCSRCRRIQDPLTDPADIEIARKLLAGEEAPRIPNGRVVRDDPDVNVGYTWQIDPESVEFADFAMEVIAIDEINE